MVHNSWLNMLSSRSSGWERAVKLCKASQEGYELSSCPSLLGASLTESRPHFFSWSLNGALPFLAWRIAASTVCTKGTGVAKWHALARRARMVLLLVDPAVGRRA